MEVDVRVPAKFAVRRCGHFAKCFGDASVMYPHHAKLTPRSLGHFATCAAAASVSSPHLS